MTNDERMQKFKKQCRTTLIAFVVVTLMTHIFPMYFLFPNLNKITIFGFPADYWLTIVIGWLGSSRYSGSTSRSAKSRPGNQRLQQ